MVVHKKVPKPKIVPKLPDDDRSQQARKQIDELYVKRRPIRLELLEKYTDTDEVKIYTEIKDYIIYSNDYYLSKTKVNNKWIVSYRVNKYGAITKYEQDLSVLHSANGYYNKCIGTTTSTIPLQSSISISTPNMIKYFNYIADINPKEIMIGDIIYIGDNSSLYICNKDRTLSKIVKGA